MQDPQFEFMRQFLLQQSGLVVEENKMYLLRTRLQPLVREHELSDLNALADKIKMQRSGALANQVVDAMTTNETLFFRDQYPYDALRDVMLPECTAKTGATIRIWSAASSTGQEAYSIAMTAAEALPGAATRVKIIGSDISEKALAKAASGSYSQIEVQRGMPARLLIQHFEQDGNNWTLKDNIRRMVSFRGANLVSSGLAGDMRSVGPFNIVFCRNVLIYFAVDARLEVIDNLARCMCEGGFLVTGAAEIPRGRYSEWEAIHVGNRNLWRLTKKP
ncbi:MAG: protein-glutamate O-methyltransferase CheR [Mariprofundaceae bacterium]